MKYFDRASAGVRVVVERLTATDDDTMFTPYFCTVSGALSIGATTINCTGLVSEPGFPDAGTVDVDLGLAVHDVITYTHRLGNQLLGVSGVAHNHVDGSAITTQAPGKGLGDSTDATVGGKLASAEAES